MKTHNKIFFGIILSLATILLGCEKEEENFSYEPQNEVAIKTDTTAFVVSQLDTLKIKTTLTESLPKGEDYTYNWEIFLQSQGTVRTTISETKDLASRITVIPGAYYLRYKITSKQTNVSYLALYRLTVNGSFYQGWLVSSNTGGQGKLSFIRTDNVVFNAPAESVNNHSYPGKALGAQAGIGSGIALIYYFTDQGAYRFNANDFLQNGDASAIIPSAKSFKSIPNYAVSQLLTDQILVGDGGLYLGLGPLFFPAEVLKPFSDRVTGDYSLFPAVIPSAQLTSYYYDNKYQRFMQSAYLSRELTVCPATASASFNMASVGRKMLAFDAGSTTGTNKEYFFILENSTGRYLQSIKGGTPDVNQLIGNSPEIATATAFATSSVLKHMYYASANKIYVYDILANSSRLVYTFPAGYVVADIEMLRATSKRLVVAANRGTTGEVYYFDLDNIGTFAGNTYTNKFEGFGEINQLSYRK